MTIVSWSKELIWLTVLSRALCCCWWYGFDRLAQRRSFSQHPLGQFRPCFRQRGWLAMTKLESGNYTKIYQFPKNGRSFQFFEDTPLVTNQQVACWNPDISHALHFIPKNYTRITFFSNIKINSLQKVFCALRAVPTKSVPDCFLPPSDKNVIGEGELFGIWKFFMKKFPNDRKIPTRLMTAYVILKKNSMQSVSSFKLRL